MNSMLTHIRVLRGFFLLIVIVCIGTHSDMGKNSSPQNLFTSSRSQFTTKNNSRIIAQKSGLAVLPCVVKLNSPATVSWIRRRDFQLLTVGLSTHSSDKRFLVEHTRHMGHWSLRIKSVREEDRGLYECQLSIYPTQSIFIELKIVEAVAEIVGTPDIHIDEGSTLHLNCKLKRATESPAFVFWYHDNKMVNYDAQDGFSVKSNLLKDPSVLESNNGKIDEIYTKSSNKSIYQLPSLRGHQQVGFLQSITISTLIIQKVHFHHAGNYTCAPSNARSASASVHVLQDEKPAAMQHYNRTIFDGDSGNNSINISGIAATSTSSYLSIDNCYDKMILLYVFEVCVESIERFLYIIQTYLKFSYINR